MYFLYHLSPISVTIKEERRNFLHFITRLCAVLGVTFALTGSCLFPFFFLLSIVALYGTHSLDWLVIGTVSFLIRIGSGDGTFTS